MRSLPMTTEESTQLRARTFIAAVKDHRFGRCPKPVSHMPPLDRIIQMMVLWEPGNTVVKFNPCRYFVSKREMKYVIKVCKRLGYTPKWKKRD